MPELPYPYYQVQADGPDETGLHLTVKVETGAGGALPNISEEQLIAHLKEYLAGADGKVAVRASAYAIQVTEDL
ncbi:hypothetical protein [Streptomyces sp. YKOK-I1]